MVAVATNPLHNLRDLVQRNCHISDANHAGNYTMCIYLLKMREYYRWEQKQSQSSPLKSEQVGKWLRDREELWNELESNQFLPINIQGQDIDPFDTNTINKLINSHGLVYSAGLGIKLTPHFFLAKLESEETYENYTVYISSTEYARDITSPPAMTLDNKIYIRKESIKRMIWERYEQWLWNKPNNAMKNTIACYDFKNDIDSALEEITNHEVENIILHEIGEIQAGKILGQQWESLIAKLPHTKAEIMLRAIRDHIADSITTLPTMLHYENTASIHFYFANLTNMRKHLSPSLLSAYNDWLKSGDLSQLKELITLNRTHWLSLSKKILTLFDNDKQPQKQIEALIEHSRL